MSGTGERRMDLDGLLGAARRRRGIALSILAIALTGAAGLSVFLPDVYRATVTLLVERGDMSATLARNGAPDDAETQIQTLSQQILSRSRLVDLVRRFGLYPGLVRSGASPDAIADRMRNDIVLDVKAADASTGRQTTIAFSLGYRGGNPATVAQVTNALGDLYVEENSRSREGQANEALDFLNRQLDAARVRLDAEEARVAEYKTKHNGELPQQVEPNLATLERLNGQLQANAERQSRLGARRDEIARRALSSDPAAGPVPPETRLAGLREELAQLLSKDSESHPDVIRVRAEIAALEREMADAPSPDPSRKGSAATAPSSPEVRGLDAELRGLQEQERQLRRSIDQYQTRVEQAPGREQELHEVSRDYESAKDAYAGLLKRVEEAQLNQNVEKGKQGERFRVLDPALAPEAPIAPRRLRLLVAGIAFAFVAAAGAVLLKERLDDSFHSVDELRAFTRVPVLAVIPRLPDRARERRETVRAWAGGFATVLGMSVALLVAYVVAREAGALLPFLSGGAS